MRRYSIPISISNVMQCQGGLLSTVEGSCTVVRDLTDFCFHSYFSYMDELSEDVHPDDRPIDIK